MAVTALPPRLCVCSTVAMVVLTGGLACEGSAEPQALAGTVPLPGSALPGASEPRADGPGPNRAGSSSAMPGSVAPSVRSAWGDGGSPAAPSAPEAVAAELPLSATEVEVEDDGEQTWVFEPAAVHTYDLTLDPEVWAELQRNARDEQYVPAELRAAGRALSRVGLRFKGSLGTLESCFAEDGSLRCAKLSMKLEFDEYVAEQRFFGLRRLNFNSMLSDDTRMHERLAYRVYRELGLVAPRSAHARLRINGEDWGLFSLVEEVDGRFTDQHFEAGDGNLYKEVWPGKSDESLLAEALKTNEELADHSGFLQFDAELRAARVDQLPAVVERYLDVDAALAYLAVDQTLVNWDGVAAFYCYGGAYCENHNYYWYQAELEPRFTLVPWDLDNTFESSLLTAVPGLLEVPADCSVRYEATARQLEAPGCDALLRGLVSRRADRYGEQLERLLAGPFAPGVIEGWIEELEVQLEPEVRTDSRGPEVSVFRSAVARLRANVPVLRERAQRERERLR